MPENSYKEELERMRKADEEGKLIRPLGAFEDPLKQTEKRAAVAEKEGKLIRPLRLFENPLDQMNKRATAAEKEGKLIRPLGAFENPLAQTDKSWTQAKREGHFVGSGESSEISVKTPEQRQEQLESARALDSRQLEEGAQGEPQQESGDKRIGVMFFSILLLLCVIADFIDMLTVGTVGWLIGLFVDAILLLSFGLSRGGRKQFKKMVVGVIGDSIPVLAILPFRSFFLIWTFVKSRQELPIQLGLSGYKQTELGE